MVKKLDNATFEEVKNAGLAIVDFSATWCGPCKMLAPVVDELSEKNSSKASFYNVDIDDCMDIAREYKIMSVPTVMAFKNGEVIGRSIGYKDEEEMQGWIDSLQ